MEYYNEIILDKINNTFFELKSRDFEVALVFVTLLLKVTFIFAIIVQNNNDIIQYIVILKVLV